jgi:hypothetical protein
MSHIINLQHITNIENLEKILTTGLLFKQKPVPYNEEDQRSFIFFDYIGIYNQKIFYSAMGLTTANKEGVVLILDFWSILCDYIRDDFENMGIFISSDYVNYTDIPEEVWSADLYREKYGERFIQLVSEGYSREEILAKIKDSEMEDALQRGIELVFDLYARPDKTHKYFDIKPYLKEVVCKDEKTVGKILKDSGLHNVKISSYVKTFSKADYSRLLQVCEQIKDESTNEDIFSLAKSLNIDLETEDKIAQSCVRLYEYLLMIKTLDNSNIYLSKSELKELKDLDLWD